MHGRIIKGIAGFYYVYAPDSNVYACRARGIFRKNGQKPLVGDNVEFEVTHVKDMEGSITDLLPRKNALIRPNVANIDQALIVFSLTYPEPNLLMLDKLLLQFCIQGIPSVICFSKEDLVSSDFVKKMMDVYKGAGCPVISVCSMTGEGIEELKGFLYGKTTSVAGPSGVGKSTLINSLQDNIRTKTGEVSAKAERGKQTTRHSEIIPIGEDTFIMDTPGFSSFLLNGTRAEEIKDHYPEFKGISGCYYTPCTHTHEPGCSIKRLVDEGKIDPQRYENYTLIYGELKAGRRY